MTHTFQRQVNQSAPMAVRGEGIHLFDHTGKRYIDASGGPSVACLGHNDPDVRAALHAQIDAVTYVSNQFFTTAVAEELADIIVAGAPAGIESVIFVCGGSESVEAALKLTRQYFVEKGETRRRHIIGRRQSWHGASLGALAVGGHAQRRDGYEPMLPENHHIAPCYAYRYKEPGETEEAYGQRVADELEAKVQELGPETCAAFIAETVVGATTGAVAPVPGYFKRIREICDRHGMLLILDEIMCGMGRTGTLHACEQEDVVPDIMTVAKGLGAGYQPIGAVLAHKRVVDAVRSGSGTLKHGITYMAHPVACAAGLAVQKAIRDRNLLANVKAEGEHLAERLQERFGNHRHIGDIRGRGLFWALEFVADRTTKATFDPGLQLHARIKAEGMARGLIVYPTGGTADGRRGDHVIVSPPFTVTGEQIDDIVDLLGETVDGALAGLDGCLPIRFTPTPTRARMGANRI